MPFKAFAILCFGLTIYAQDIAFVGTPTVRVDSDPESTKRVELSDIAGEKYQCRVVRKGRGYIWASRDDRKLIRADAGDWTYYISPEGSGYVKVLKGEGNGHDYMEHVTGQLKSVTYWGKRTGP
jgi:hypothetical protein